MQVMPATGGDPGFGIAPSNGTPADDVRVGEQYLAAMHARYGGDLAKMWAAYQSGPGTVDKLVAQYGRSWWQHLGPQGKAYLDANLGRAMAKGFNPQAQQASATAPTSPPPANNPTIIKRGVAPDGRPIALYSDGSAGYTDGKGINQTEIDKSRRDAVISLYNELKKSSPKPSPEAILNMLNHDENGNPVGDFTIDEVNRILAANTGKI